MKETFPQRLKSARIMRGWSMEQLARELEPPITKQAVHKYEHGRMYPDSDTLLALSHALEVKPDYFFRPFRYQMDKIEFRKKNRLGKRELEAIKERVRDQVERYLEVESFLNIRSDFSSPLSPAPVESGEEVETAVEQLRARWNLGKNALPNVVELLEDQEIKVVELEAEPGFDGFAGWVDGNVPVIVINNALAVERKRFTALHELGHLLLPFREDLDPKEAERYCHRFAGAMLIPRETFLKEVGEKRRNISLAELIPLKEEYGISIQALMRRALDLGVVSDGVYRSFCVRISGNREEKGLGGYIGKEYSDRFQQLVFRAAAEEIISMSKAANLAGMKLGAFREGYLVGYTPS